MAARAVHQVMAALSYGDAVSNDALALQAHLRASGLESDIYAEHAHPRMAARCRRMWEYARVSSPETVCLFHFAIGSGAGRMAFTARDRPSHPLAIAPRKRGSRSAPPLAWRGTGQYSRQEPVDRHTRSIVARHCSTTSGATTGA